MSLRLSKSEVMGAGWAAWVVLALLMLPFLGGSGYLLLTAVSALVLAGVAGALQRRARARDREDLLVIAVIYVAVVALMRLAFVGFTTDNTLGLFLSFAAALIIGAAGPVVYTSWRRGRSLATLGLQAGDLRRTATLALLFAGVQFALTLWGYDLPAPVDWVPLLVMALVVGVFESVLFLTGLGVVYAVAFALTRSVLVLWPLLTPLGSFFAQVEAGDIELPWASIMGFADVLAVIVAVILIAQRHAHGRQATEAASHPVGV